MLNEPSLRGNDAMTWDGNAYCGPAPTPDRWLGSWNFDPVLLLALAAMGGAFLLLRPGATARQLGAFWAGWAVLALAFVSPLCALTVALFSARIVHHVVLVALAAPLLAMALAPWRPKVPLTVLVIVHTAAFWLWHAPDAYGLALSHGTAYWAMQASLLLTAIPLWAQLLDKDSPALGAFSGLLAMIVQMGLLGALLTFAPDPLYAPHLSTTQAFGLTPLADQQLGGLIMWVPAALPYLAAALWRLTGLLAPRAVPGA